MSNLNLDQVSPSQASKEATINLAIAELENAMTEMVTYSLTANFAALLIDEQRNGRILCTGVPSAGTTLTLLPVKRALIVSNAAGAAGTLTVAMGTTTLTVAPGINQIIYCDGTTNGMVAIGGSGSGLPTGGSDGQLLARVAGAAAWVSRGDNTGAHAYWQIRVHAVAGPPQRFGVGEVEFRAYVGGPQLATGGTPTLLPDVYGGRPASNAFDGDITTMAMTNSNIDGVTNAYLKYHFAAPVQVHELSIVSTNESGYSPQCAPGTFDVQYSDDDVTYTTAWTVTGAVWSGTSMRQNFRSPSDFSSVLSALSDVDLSTAPTNGQVLTYNATTKKWSAATVAVGGGGATTLAALTDVAVTEGAGIDGQFLKWNNATSKWVPAAVSGGGGGSADTMFARAADIVKPTSSMFTLVQSASNAFMADTTRGVFFKFSGGVAHHNMAIMRRAMPSTPYTIKAQAMALGNPFNYSGWGIAVADGSSKSSLFALTGSTVTGSGSTTSTGFRFDIQDSSALGTYAADAPYENHGSTVSLLTPVWLRMQDDGTTLYYAWSNDGEHWRDVVSRSRTAYVASPTYIGIMLNIVLPDDTKDFGIHLFSYAELAGIV